ncbi:response regulator transcription factor [Cohnella panacarvi]|uniref:response regulator transcription factor n=1 Tax=Cohnella panacarvi TaxID=400776 RepID=UPI00047C1014|nr:response regulator [Cohnella panacarvi]
MRTKAILIVDDEPRTRQGLKSMLEKWGTGNCRIMTADNGHEALRMLRESPIDLMITDIRMPEISGLQLAAQIQESQLPHQPAVILISGYAEFEYAQQAIQLGVVNYLLKPVSREKLIEAARQALDAGEERNRVGIMRKFVDPQLLETDADRANLSETIRKALDYIDEHLAGTISLREVAEYVHLNASYFSVLFKEQLHMTFSEFIARKKLQKAKEMLVTTKLPIAEIAERVGYQTAKYFNKVFKEYEGRSPGQYRSELTEDPNDIQ